MNLVFIYGPPGAGKLTERLDIFSPVAGRESLEVDNTALAPEEVARLIVEHYHLPAA